MASTCSTTRGPSRWRSRRRTAMMHLGPIPETWLAAEIQSCSPTCSRRSRRTRLFDIGAVGRSWLSVVREAVRRRRLEGRQQGRRRRAAARALRGEREAGHAPAEAVAVRRVRAMRRHRTADHAHQVRPERAVARSLRWRRTSRRPTMRRCCATRRSPSTRSRLGLQFVRALPRTGPVPDRLRESAAPTRRSRRCYHFPWLVKANVRWSVFNAVTKRPFRKTLDWSRSTRSRSAICRIATSCARTRGRRGAHGLGCLGFCAAIRALDEVAWGSSAPRSRATQKKVAVVPRARGRRVHRVVLEAHQGWRADQKP